MLDNRQGCRLVSACRKSFADGFALVSNALQSLLYLLIYLLILTGHAAASIEGATIGCLWLTKGERWLQASIGIPLAQGRAGGREQPGGTAGKINGLTCFGPCQCLLRTRAFNPLVARLNLVEPARIQALQL